MSHAIPGVELVELVPFNIAVSISEVADPEQSRDLPR
jgi:hypothetical protein